MSIRQKIKERIIREFFRSHSYPKRNAIDRLLTERPFDFSPAWEKAFLEAMRHSLNHHVAHSEFYSRLCAYRKFEKKDLASFEDIWDIPFILCDVFKHHLIETKTGDILRTEFNSSGTSGRKSRITVDVVSGQRLLFSIYHIYRALGVISEKPANYLMMGYNLKLDETIGTTISDVIVSYLTPRKDIFFALDANSDGRIEFLRDQCVEKLKAFIEEGLPVRVLGFVHHMCEVIMAYRRKYGKVVFPKDSYILTGGGWKGAVNPYGEDFDLFKFLQENTTIDIKNVRDLYTLNEHLIFYLECEHHNMHIPNSALICARSPRLLRRLPDGQTGLLHLYSPIVESCPLISILTTDYGYVGRSCTCSVGGPYLKIIGRAGLTKKVTCAFTADQYVKEAVTV